jgi:type I restriction enzyme R subunit
VLSSIAARLVRLDRELTPNDRTALTETANGQTLSAIAGDIVSALDPDRHVEAARAAVHLPSDVEPNEEEIAQARRQMAHQPIQKAEQRTLAFSAPENTFQRIWPLFVTVEITLNFSRRALT